MALISCPECSKEISDKAKSCPNCGLPITSTEIYKAKKIQEKSSPENNPFGKGSVLWLLVAVVVIGLLVWIYQGISNQYWRNKTSKGIEQQSSLANNKDNPPILDYSISQVDMADKNMESTNKYVPELKNMYDTLSSHYSYLQTEYGNQKESYDVNSWTVFLNEWNNTLKEYRNELDSYDITGKTYTLFYIKNQLNSAATDMSVVWIYYSNLLDGKDIDKNEDDLDYFTNNIEKGFKESKTSLDEL